PTTSDIVDPEEISPVLARVISATLVGIRRVDVTLEARARLTARFDVRAGRCAARRIIRWMTGVVVARDRAFSWRGAGVSRVDGTASDGSAEVAGAAATCIGLPITESAERESAAVSGLSPRADIT
ncbi:MAG TPA: hypothetical protein VD758_00725, partial [Gemmatimonadaceae bacterium]|nr:hypothetical protein [Gemmatimonadaceae bacterium]